MATMLERFEKFYTPVTETGCWLWLGSVSNRYGELWDGRRNVRAHRYSFETFKRQLADGEVVCHKCDTPTCVNPEHLFAGTQSDNLLDCVAKGRKPIREESDLYRGAVNPEIVRDIRRRRVAGERNCDVARRHGISNAYCSTIARGIHWPEVA